MAYNSRVTGEWRIDPPLTGPERHGLPEFEWICVRVNEDVKDMDDGSTVTHRWGVAVEPAREGKWSYYELREELELLRRSLPLPQHLDGYIVRVGEDVADVERFWPGPGVGVLSEFAELRWPDGSTIES